MDKIELLSPAGDMERLKVTLLYGADAVYIGGEKYSLRANATNFSMEEIKEACTFAHSLGKKVYQTINIVFHNEDIDGVYDYIRESVTAGIDAFIVSDPFIISYIKENFKNVEVHLSTQNSTTNYDTVLFFKEKGIDRIVPARELRKEEIKELIDKTGIDIEVFIHGSMCTFYSGRCTLSNYLTNRDSNRGGCSQVCRFVFNIEDYAEKFSFATKDLNLAKYIKDLIEIGVRSLKVEGRMRSLYYLATVIGTYRKIIDAVYEDTLTEEYFNELIKTLNKVANRETSTHYFDKEANVTDQYFTGRQELSNQDYLALVIGYDKKKKRLIISERNYFKVGDKVEIFTPSGKIYRMIIDKIYDEDDKKIEVARHPKQILKIDFEEELEEYTMIRLLQEDSHGE